MKRVNGIIVEATEAELKEIWLSSNWSKTASFESFKRLMIDVGCNIIEVKEICENDSAEVVQPKTLEKEKIVIVDQQKKVKTIVSDISEQTQSKKTVKDVSTETEEAKNKPMSIITPKRKV